MSACCGLCVYLNEKKKRCDKFSQKLSYSKHTGTTKFTVFEKCTVCNICSIVDAPNISLSEDEKPGEALLNFYRGLGWNGEDTLDPCKIRTTKEVYNNLYDTMFDSCPDSVGVGMLMVNSGPGTDDYVPPGKVYLLEGWITPTTKEGDETNGF